MKKRIHKGGAAALLGLCARGTLLPLLGTALLVGGAETLIFGLRLKQALRLIGAGREITEFYLLCAPAGTQGIFAAGMLLTLAVLSLVLADNARSRTEYTVKRFAEGERCFFFLQAGYNILMIALYLLWQMAVMLALGLWYARAIPEVGGTAVLMSFYRSEFLHSLLPLEDGWVWVRNGVLIAALGITAAEVPYRLRRRRFPAGLAGLFCFALVFFARGINDGGNVFLVITVSVILSACAVGNVLRGDREVTEDAE